MCGIAGYWSFESSRSEALHIVREMSCALAHRGPNDEGAWYSEAAGVALGHKRLSIVDLSPEGHQPMISRDGRLVMVFNGEIYNHEELRGRLKSEGVRFRGTSDTEVLLEAFSRWGIAPTLQRAVGMFAIAVWDQEQRVMSLARDRLGEKPLYWGVNNGHLLFASELKALRCHPAFHSTIDRRALTQFFRYGYIPSPYSIYSGIQKLSPATIATIRSDRTVGHASYWSLTSAVESGLAGSNSETTLQLVDELDAQLTRTVREQMVADVPLGALLSGGIDSSTIVALMQKQSSSAVRTFTIGFAEREFNEASYARDIAGHLGTDHTELFVTPQDALDVIPDLSKIYDEPFADSSQIPTYLVCKLARSRVTVALSGDGGDELFGGYNRYTVGDGLWRRLRGWPMSARKASARLLRAFSPQVWDGMLIGASKVLRRPHGELAHFGDRLHKVAGLLDARSQSHLYQLLVSQWPSPVDLVIGGSESSTDSELRAALPIDLSFVEQMMFTDTLTYLPGDILVKVDRASMAVSLECRAPFLDHRVVELAWRLPFAAKVYGREGKWILRELLAKYVPRPMFERPKMGFGVPLAQWLRGPLRDWAGDLLNSDRVRRDGFLNLTLVAKTFDEHQAGTRNWQYRLWCILMFQAWLEQASSN